MDNVNEDWLTRDNGFYPVNSCAASESRSKLLRRRAVVVHIGLHEEPSHGERWVRSFVTNASEKYKKRKLTGPLEPTPSTP